MSNNFNIRGKYIKSKFFFAPVNTGFSVDGDPNSKLLKFHSIFSGKEIGISYIGNISIEKKYRTNNSTFYLSEKSNEYKWRKLLNMIKENGSLPAVQLGCKSSKIDGIKVFRSNDKNEYLKKSIKEFRMLKKNELKDIINTFVDSAIKLHNYGVDIIQLHCAHGYFLSQSISEFFNCREDEYGDKVRIIKEIVELIREKAADLIIDLRISIFEGFKKEKEEIVYKKHLLTELSSLDIDMISISNGIYNVDKNMIYPSSKKENCYLEEIVNGFSLEISNVRWNVSGNIKSIRDLKYKNNDNMSYSICRSLLSDPFFIEKEIGARKEKVIKCISCNRCHYFSNDEKEIKGCIEKLMQEK